MRTSSAAAAFADDFLEELSSKKLSVHPGTSGQKAAKRPGRQQGFFQTHTYMAQVWEASLGNQLRDKLATHSDMLPFPNTPFLIDVNKHHLLLVKDTTSDSENSIMENFTVLSLKALL